MKRIILIYLCTSLLAYLSFLPASLAESKIIGNRQYIHLENDKGTWWLVDHVGKRFITTGMNHIDEGKILFNAVNKGWLAGVFGKDIQAPWGPQLNRNAKKIDAFADMVVKDFKDFGFNTIPFHAYTVPYELYEARKIYYIAKLKVQNISLMHMNRKKGGRFPDVFSKAFQNKLDVLARKTCTPLRDAKYCLGYTFYDMPELKPLRPWQRWMFPDKGLIYPWVQDMRALPASAEGKKAWMAILKANHASASEAARTYALQKIQSWTDLAKVRDWPVEPANKTMALKDAEDMMVAIAEKWYKLHHETIKKYDPNHLIIGDKHDVGYLNSVTMVPDPILKVIGKYTDVLMIQYYSFYTDQHNKVLKHLYEKSGLPIINGDHAYSHKTDKQTKVKGLNMPSYEAVADEYVKYMKNSMKDHPYMLGWWYCGYIEQWDPAGTSQGQQCGLFTPFGEPNMALLPKIKQANEKAVSWHRKQ